MVRLARSVLVGAVASVLDNVLYFVLLSRAHASVATAYAASTATGVLTQYLGNRNDKRTSLAVVFFTFEAIVLACGATLVSYLNRLAADGVRSAKSSALRRRLLGKDGRLRPVASLLLRMAVQSVIFFHVNFRVWSVLFPEPPPTDR